jgi:hypothetical protein
LGNMKNISFLKYIQHNIIEVSVSLLKFPNDLQVIHTSDEYSRLIVC